MVVLEGSKRQFTGLDQTASATSRDTGLSAEKIRKTTDRLITSSNEMNAAAEPLKAGASAFLSELRRTKG